MMDMIDALGTASWERTRVFRNGLVNIASSENGWASLLIRSFQELRAAGFCSPRCPSILYSACELLLTSIFQTQSITLWQRIHDHFAWVRETGDWTFAVHSWKLKAKDVRKYAPDPCARHSQQDLTAAGNLEEKTIDKLNKERKKTTDKATKDCTNCTNTVRFHMLRHWPVLSQT